MVLIYTCEGASNNVITFWRCLK